MNYKKRIAEIISGAVDDINQLDVENLIEIPPKEIDFDYSFPCYILSKLQKKAPQQIAENLVEIIKKPEFLSLIRADGPYVNFKINRDILAKDVLKDIYIKKDSYGKIKSNEKEQSLKMVIEYPSPNTNKPLHLGHVRNICIGQTVSRLQRYIGNEVFEVNLFNDRGIHICKSMVGYQEKWKNKTPKTENMKPDHFVGQSYVTFSIEAEKNNHLIEKASNYLVLWEENDPEIRELWKKMNSWAYQGFNETFNKLGVRFDKVYYESDIYSQGKDIILNAVDNAYIKVADNGAIIADLEEFNLGEKVLLRGDGTSLYITQDIYLAKKKREDFNYDKSIIVVGSEQDMYFQQLFKVLELLGFEEEMYHLSYGMIYLPEGKMKSREGITVDADALIDEMESLANIEINKRYSDLNEKEVNKRAKAIGASALRFFILNYDPKKDFTYDPAKSIAFEGDTGPYIQYVFARIQSIINKANIEMSTNADFSLLTHETEHDLLFTLYLFPEKVIEAANSFKPHVISQYLITLAQKFNTFYDNCPVISSDVALKKGRLLLIKCIQIVIKIGLNLLGIEVLEQM